MTHKFEPLKKQPAYLQVYNAVEADILSGKLSEGAVLQTEAQLCEQFGVTRATVREGLRLLEQADLVQRGAAKRFYVKRPDASDIASATSKGLALGGATFREVWEALSAMYPQAARLAALRLDEADTEALRAIHRKLKDASETDGAMTVELAVEFFQCIAGGLDNRVLLAMLQSLNLMIGASLKKVIRKTPHARARILEAQSRIVAAIEARDEKEAARWIAKHIDDLKRGYAIAEMDLDKNVL